MVAVAMLKKIMRFQSDLEIIRNYHAIPYSKIKQLYW